MVNSTPFRYTFAIQFLIILCIESVAKWKQLTAKIVTTKERFRGADMAQREGSPVPGIELYDTVEGN